MSEEREENGHQKKEGEFGGHGPFHHKSEPKAKEITNNFPFAKTKRTRQNTLYGFSIIEKLLYDFSQRRVV